jgi:hypothetical protein
MVFGSFLEPSKVLLGPWSSQAKVQCAVADQAAADD